MGENSKIEWTDCTWNPVIGCQHVAEGCRNCYAEKMSKRLAAMGQDDYAQVLDAKGRFNGRAITRPETLAEPLHWRKPRKVFVNSMSDLFHEDVPFEFIAAVYGVMAACPQHTFQVLTKRPERMLEFMEWAQGGTRVADAMRDLQKTIDAEPVASRRADMNKVGRTWNLHAGAENLDAGNEKSSWPLWPLKNVWHGTSIAEPRDLPNVKTLRRVPSVVRFISYEPAIAAVDLRDDLWVTCRECDGAGMVGPDGSACNCAKYSPRPGYERRNEIHWVIVGGESGPGARPCDVAWIRSIVQQCKAAGVACFVKQLGAVPVDRADDLNWEPGHVPGQFHALAYADGGHPLKDRKGGSPEEWPEDLRVRQFPEAQ
jgi:protein gp37